MVANCANCGRPNGILAFGQDEGKAIPLCIDCYEKFQSVHLKTLHAYQYAAWEAEQQMNDHFESFGIPVERRPPPPSPTPSNIGNTVNSISVRDSQVGAINTGAIGSFAQSVTQLKHGGQGELAADLNALITAVLGAPEFNTAVKNEIVELLGSVAEQASQPSQNRKAALGRVLLKRLGELLSDASSVSKLWERLSDLLAALF